MISSTAREVILPPVNENYYWEAERFYLGIDPGLRGAIAVLSDQGKIIELHDMPVMMKGKGGSKVKNQVNAAALYKILTDFEGAQAVMESIGSMPGQGVASMFSLGDSFGVIRAILAACNISVEFVTPQSWKKYYKIASDKELARAKAIQLFPEASLARKKDSDRAEALLMAKYGLDVAFKASNS